MNYGQSFIFIMLSLTPIKRWPITPRVIESGTNSFEKMLGKLPSCTTNFVSAKKNIYISNSPNDTFVQTSSHLH